MNCKYLKVKAKNYRRFCYCDMLKKEINFNYCKYCDIKAYKEYKTMKQRTYHIDNGILQDTVSYDNINNKKWIVPNGTN